MLTATTKRSTFRTLHQQGCFVLPNPWDAGSARLLQHMGFTALASTSSGYAWTTGRADNTVTRDDVLGHLRAICDAVDLPVNADFESGFAGDTEGLAANVQLAVQTGVAGLSIEDRDVDALERLYDTRRAVERVIAACDAIKQTQQDVLLVARTEGLLIDPKAVKPAIDKLVAFADAGADVLYAPGVRDSNDIATMVRAVAPKPLNVLVMSPDMTVAQLADLGVRRISVGGALARVGWGAVMAAAEQMKAGSFQGLAKAASGNGLNEMFGKFDER
jgi:2-methylisocitrate lyase-like PEP mutase family enzyme